MWAQRKGGRVFSQAGGTPGVNRDLELTLPGPSHPAQQPGLGPTGEHRHVH